MLPAFISMICPASARATTLPVTVKGLEHWTIKRFTTAAELRAHWPAARRPDDFWLDKEVLSFLADQPQGLMTEGIVLENGKDFSHVLLTAQTFSFSADGQVSGEVKGNTSSYDFRRRLLAPFSFRVLCLGQFLTSGNFATSGLGQLPAAEGARLLAAVADTLMRAGRGYAAYLVKDIYPAGHAATAALRAEGHYLLPCDPVMQLDLAAHWRQTEDYLADLSSKYRVRYRRARGKAEGISRRRLSAQEVSHYQDELYHCYREVSSGADFNAATVQPGYFPWLASVRRPARHLAATLTRGGYEAGCVNDTTPAPAAVRVHGYFNEADELIGFTTAIPNGSTLHAHYLGLRSAYKRSHHLYHNMLFDLLEDGIAGGFATLDYGRTALEIKSSVGATPVAQAVLVKARYGWLNRLIPIFTPAVYKAPQWTARSPFRDAT